MKKKVLIGIVAALLLTLIIGLNIYRGRQANSLAVQYFPVKLESIKENVLASGRVEVENSEEITARTNAMVEEVLVAEGDLVKAGQVLIKLNSEDLVRDLEREKANLAVQKANLIKMGASARYQEVEQDRAALKRAEITFENSRVKYERAKALFQQGAVSSEAKEEAYVEYVSAETEYHSAQQRLSLRLEGETVESKKALQALVKQAELSVKLAEEQLARTVIKASMDGTVLNLTAENGKYVSIGTSLVEIGDMAHMRVKADVSESDSGGLAVGQPVRVIATALPDQEFGGKVSRVGAAAVTKNKSGNEQTDVQVTVAITKFNSALKPGYSVDLTITTASESQAMVVPYDAIIEKDKKKEVFVIRNGKAEKKQVITGVGNELYVTIKKGLNKGDKVVVLAPDKLKAGDAVSETLYEEGTQAKNNSGGTL